MREHEWDNRHFWRVSNAEHLKLSEDVGMVNLSHFAIYDAKGPDAERLLEKLSVAKIGGDARIGKGIYTHWLDEKGGVKADLVILKFDSDHFRIIDGGDAGNRDFTYMQRQASDLKLDKIELSDETDNYSCLGLWGPNARTTLEKVVDDPDSLSQINSPFASVVKLTIAGVDVQAFRISYVGEQGWELHFRFADGLAVWDALAAQDVTPIGVETYANSRRLEKSLRLQNADLLTHYNLYEADLARPKVKADEFIGKKAYLEQRQLDQQIATLCTLVMTENTDSNGIARYPVGICPIIDPSSGEVPVDSLGRRSYTTSIAYGPTIGKNIALGYLPAAYASIGKQLAIEYFGEQYAVEVAAVGYQPLYDPENLKPRS